MIGVISGDTRSIDYSSCVGLGLWRLLRCGYATPGIEHMLRNLRKSKIVDNAGEVKCVPQL